MYSYGAYCLVVRRAARLTARHMHRRTPRRKIDERAGQIITRPERRRRWSDEEKLELVAEACRPGSSVSQVARERGVSASQLFGWRRQALAKGLVTDCRPEASAVQALTFTAVGTWVRRTGQSTRR
jgi:transposase-like protein